MDEWIFSSVSVPVPRDRNGNHRNIFQFQSPPQSQSQWQSPPQSFLFHSFTVFWLISMEHTAEQPAEQPAEPQPLDALMFQAWTTIYSTYRLYFAATYERPLPVQAAASNIDLRFNIGNFKLQVAGDHIRNGANVTGREVVVMSTIFAMSAAAFLGFIVNAFKKNN
ncbi:hypothetical protein QL285_018350 [Trifolium repens]|nr:hypothetical protein QL285_018350 [Trifolium repens]